ncbi:FMN-binding protein [Candidatus Woesearchaeota archaeon]|nr:FMN-binding protein [Candidatus Woesearchaeota archaeon]
MKETIKLGATLMIVTLIASVALAITNHYTAPRIEMQKELAVKESLNKVITADSFEEKDGYYDAYGTNGDIIGRVIKIEVHGYSSMINALAGVSLENEITGIDVISQQDTPGLGANIQKDRFLWQFRGKTREQIRIKKDGGEIDAVTGATISSRAITDGIRMAMEEFPCGKDGDADNLKAQYNAATGNETESREFSESIDTADKTDIKVAEDKTTKKEDLTDKNETG